MPKTRDWSIPLPPGVVWAEEEPHVHTCAVCKERLPAVHPLLRKGSELISCCSVDCYDSYCETSGASLLLRQSSAKERTFFQP